MDLRAFGVGPRTWLQVLTYRRRDRVLIWIGVAVLVVSIVVSILGFGQFWVPPGLLSLVGG
ncbi:MAG: hypothetical protein AB1750_03630, partial [Chloroflexota bacterium]